FEHLDCENGIRLMRDCYRLLSNGGVFRIALPNFRRVFDAYLKQDWQYFDLLNTDKFVLGLPSVDSKNPVLIDFINYSVYQYGEHKCCYDVEKVSQILKGIGYHSIIETPYKENIDVANKLRTKYTFYVDAVK